MGQKQTFVTNLTDVFPTNKDGLGTIRAENNAVYKYVQFTGTTATNVGDVVCYVAPASDGQSVVVDKANSAMGAGVAMAAVPSGAVAYSWIQVKGIAVVSGAVPGTNGQALTTTGATAGNVAVIGAFTHSSVGEAYDVTSRKMMCDFMY